MSYNGSGTFVINTTGQPVVLGTVISSTAFNSLTADLATGLSTAITKDGQTATTARIPFAAGINSTLVTDSTNTTTGSILTAGGVGIAKALNIGTSATIGTTLTYGGVTLTAAVTGTGKMVLDTNSTISTSLPTIDNIKMGYTTTATAGGTTTLTAASNYQQFFTGTLAQTIVLPVTSTLALGLGYHIENNSTGTLTVQSSGLNTISTIPPGVTTQFTCILITGTTAASWDYDHIGFAAITGTGSAVLGTSPTITTPTISQLSSAAATSLILQSAGATAITVDTSQNTTLAGTLTTSSRGIAKASMPAGTVLQVVSTIKTDTFSTTSGTLTDLTGMSASITPTSTSSKILIQYSIGQIGPGADQAMGIALIRGSTLIGAGATAGSRILTSTAGVYPSDRGGPQAFCFLDSPATISSTTYKLQIYVAGGTTVYVNRSATDTDTTTYARTASTITIMEIAA